MAVTNRGTLIGLDYITVETAAANLASDIETALTIKIVNGDDSKSPGSQVDTAYVSAGVTITATDKDGAALVVNQGGTPNPSATVVNGTVVVPDFSVTIPGGPASGPVLVKVQTNLSEDTIKTITGRNYRPFGQVSKTVVTATHKFVVTAPANATRGVPFNLVIQSVLISDNSLDTAFVPAGNVTLSGVFSDPADVLSPLFTNNTGWVNGKKTVSVTISTGTGSDTATLTALDPATVRTGSASLAVAATLVGRAVTDNRVFSASVNTIEAPNAARFAADQNTVQTNFEADTTLVLSSTFERSVNVSNISHGADLSCGYIKIPIQAGDKIGLQSATLKGKFIARIGQATSVFSNEPHKFSVKVFLTETDPQGAGPFDFTSGLALKNMIETVEVEYTNINQRQVDAGGTPASPVAIELDLGLALKNFIVAMTGTDLYVWMYIDADALVDFVAPFDTAGSHSHDVFEDNLASMSLELYK